MKISILGLGCAKCNKLMENTEAAAKELGIDYQLEKVTDINDIASFGVMVTPALAINGKVVFSGKALGIEEIKPYLAAKNIQGGSAPSCGCGCCCS